GDQRGWQGGHQGKRFSTTPRVSIVNSSPSALTPGKEKKRKEETRQNVGIVSILPHGRRQCSGLVAGKRSSSSASTQTDFKEGGLRRSKFGTAGGGTCKATLTLKSL
ncbi:hypothetical protein PIB30_103136, partial [Stylosanthes scabra]|nr:hypothetical protein [Stylosanthes scabra]